MMYITRARYRRRHCVVSDAISIIVIMVIAAVVVVTRRALSKLHAGTS